MLVISHRGASSKQQSENTIEAFIAAILEGADGIEFDVRLSRDKQLVVVHDANFHRVAGNAHSAKELTADEMKCIPLRFGGVVPTLNDVTASIHEPAVLNMEIKNREAVVPLILKLKTSAGLRRRTIISSFNARILQRVKNETPDVRTQLLILRWPVPLRDKRLWQEVMKLSPWAVAFPIQLLTRKRAAFLKSKGWKAGGWDRRGTAGEARKARDLDLDIAIIKKTSEIKGSAAGRIAVTN